MKSLKELKKALKIVQKAKKEVLGLEKATVVDSGGNLKVIYY